MSLARADLDSDPLRQFERWHEEAGGHDQVALATATEDGAPSVRMVLLKVADERGFVFHSSYEGRKAVELAENPRAALLFYWQDPGRQVRVEGEVERIDPAESEAYFRTRPRGGQLAAWASTQSEPIGSREELEERFAEVEARYEGAEVPLPPNWGGFRLAPESYEFWEHRDNRLHDRFRYRRTGQTWVIERLSP
ncbi:MAG: pyridoxamine 5'-phosphate oxidase [Actinomycetota bacterium]